VGGGTADMALSLDRRAVVVSLTEVGAGLRTLWGTSIRPTALTWYFPGRRLSLHAARWYLVMSPPRMVRRRIWRLADGVRADRRVRARAPTIPVVQLAGYVALAVVAGMLASVIPARRSARSSVVATMADT